MAHPNQAMLDVHGMDQVTYEQFVQVCRDSMAAETTASASAAAGSADQLGPGAELPPEVAQALRRLSESLANDRAAAVSLFRKVRGLAAGRWGR
jgi:hypothetical protein